MDDLITPRQAALLIEAEYAVKLSASTFRRYAHDGTIPATIDSAGHIGFDRADLLATFDRLAGTN